jgi:hypothetical protein
VDLLPVEVPPPLERAERHHALSHGHFLYATERIVSARTGLQWFDASVRGHVARPKRDGTFDPLAADAPTFSAGPFEPEPPAPLLLTSSARIPFAADWQCPSRVRHLLARNFEPETIWSKDELTRATAWLEEDMHFPWSSFPEYWGSIHLIAPNPVFRGTRSRIDRSQAGIFLVNTFELRADKTVDGLAYELECRHPTGTKFVVRSRPSASTCRILLPGETAELFERVHDDKRGLLYELGPFSLLSGFDLTVNLSTEVRRVNVAHHDGTDASYEVNLIGGFGASVKTGAEREEGRAAIRLQLGRVARERRARGKEQQKWFRNQSADAVTELRALVGKATGAILAVDPYFGADDLLRVLLAVKDPEIKIDILAGAEHLRKREGRGSAEESDRFERTLSEAARGGRLNPIEIRVMQGGAPAIHDRFLQLGSDLWMLGSSLKAFGSRGTLLVKVPDPEPVVRDLRAVWDESPTFSVWLDQRRTSRRGS